MRRAALAVTLAAALAAPAGCGGGGANEGDAEAAAPPVLPGRALPAFASERTELTLDEFARTTPIDGMPERLRRLGFRAAAERQFVGRRRAVQRVVSRAAEFESAASARAWVREVARDAGAYLGGTPEVRPLRLGDRDGFLVRPPLCGCHAEMPRWIAVTSAGRRGNDSGRYGARAASRRASAGRASAPLTSSHRTRRPALVTAIQRGISAWQPHSGGR